MNGLFTFCFHPNSENDSAFERTDMFLQDHKEMFISFDEVDIENPGNKSILDWMLSWGYLQ